MNLADLNFPAPADPKEYIPRSEQAWFFNALPWPFLNCAN